MLALLRLQEIKIMARRSLEFSSVVSKEGKWYVAHCPELEITSQGKSVELALENLREAIELYLQDEDAKVFERLKSLGVSPFKQATI